MLSQLRMSLWCWQKQQGPECLQNLRPWSQNRGWGRSHILKGNLITLQDYTAGGEDVKNPNPWYVFVLLVPPNRTDTFRCGASLLNRNQTMMIKLKNIWDGGSTAPCSMLPTIQSRFLAAVRLKPSVIKTLIYFYYPKRLEENGLSVSYFTLIHKTHQGD